jgi:phosphate-selective porin
MKNKLSILLSIAFVFTLGSLYAQGCDGDAEVGLDPENAQKIKVFGFLQPQYAYDFQGQGKDNANTGEFKRARIGVRGEALENFSYYFMLEAGPFIGGTSDAYLMDAFITYRADNWARISLGTFKQPFSLELATACHALLTVERAIVVDQLVAPQRDFGLFVYGGNKYNKLNYSVAIMNGRGLLERDNNSQKDIIGRVNYKLTNFLTVGGSFRYGYPVTNDNDTDRTTVGGEFLFELDKFLVQGEYIYDEGGYNLAAGGGCGSEPVLLGDRRDGAYIMGLYKFNEKFQPVLKYEFFDPNLDLKDDGSYQERFTIGLNYFFSDRVRFQLNYLANIDTVTNVDNDRLIAQMQVKF